MMFKNKLILGFIGIMLVGIFLRTFHFSDWMHYQLDQARDFRIIHAAMEYGPGELPLQGPKAAGNVMIKSPGSDVADDKTTLRLGPLFYYLEYSSAFIFGDSPTGSVVLILIFSILTIPLFYIFCREFFDEKVSLILMAIFSVSIFFVTYSRFGWNPNLMPLFMLLFIYSLLRVSDKSGKVKLYCLESGRYLLNIISEKTKFSKNKKWLIVEKKFNTFYKHIHNSPNKVRGWWLVMASIALAFLSNMHFLALTVAPMIAIIYLFWSRSKIKIRYWLMAILVFVFLNIPLIINDVKTDGENFKAFVAALTQKSEKDTHTFPEKLIKNAGEHTRYYWLILTGDQRAELPQISDGDIRCDLDCRAGFFRGIIAFILMTLGLLAGFLLYRKEKNELKRNFLRMSILWLGINFVAYISLAYDLAPRFFLLSGPLVIVLWGMILQLAFQSKKKIIKIIVLIITAIFIISNLFFVFKYFNQLSQVENNPDLVIQTDRILKEKTRITLEQMEDIINYMESKHQENNYPIFIDAQSEYKRAFWERVDFRNIPRAHIAGDLKPLYQEGNYFIIIRSQSDQDEYLKKFLVGMDIVEKKVFGTLTIYELKPKEDFITEVRKEFKPKDRDPKFSSSAQVRYLWRQVFSEEEL